MAAFSPRNLQRHSEFTRFEDEQGLEYEVYGDESGLPFAYEIAGAISELLQQAEMLLREFMKHAGEFSAQWVEVRAVPDDDGSAFWIRHTFEPEGHLENFGYTYFDVHFAVGNAPQPRFWPIKFVVGLS